MILAVRREAQAPRQALLQQLHDIKAHYGVREHCLETLLKADALL